MIRAFDIEATIALLGRARDHAVAASLGEHFVSEIDHLIATAEANKEKKENTK